jgi:hypothetical protein
MTKNGPGFVSIQAMIILLVLTLFSAGLASAIYYLRNMYLKSGTYYEEITSLEEELSTLITILEEDPTPKSDSPLDPVWEHVQSTQGTYSEYLLEDISSRFNPNWMRTKFFEVTALSETLIAGVHPDELKDYRGQNGYSTAIEEAYKNYLDPEILPEYFTGYSYININTAYEYVLKDMYLELTGDEGGAEAFHSRIASYLQELKLFTREDFMEAAGPGAEQIFPVINVEPQMNVHFIPQFLLKQILSYPYGEKEIEGHSQIAEELLGLRDEQEILPEDLKVLIPIDEEEKTQERVFAYLGTKTWFWRFQVSNDRASLKAVIACIPESFQGESAEDEGYRYEIVMKRVGNSDL